MILSLRGQGGQHGGAFVVDDDGLKDLGRQVRGPALFDLLPVHSARRDESGAAGSRRGEAPD